ncbi:MAG: hypothetical protein JSV97_10945 [candidate division WOR-3 bacterium]|nr:MAG: hypothetical protein JSV97_10945 [candidate division WOR-3 bacterium]
MNHFFYRITGGILLIAVGLLIWFSNLGVLNIAWRRDWPVILIILGALGLVKKIFRRKK